MQHGAVLIVWLQRSNSGFRVLGFVWDFVSGFLVPVLETAL